MNVSLTARLEKFIQKQVKSGNYQTASEVVREALRLLEERKQQRQAQLEELKRDVQKALDSVDRGEGIPVTDELFEDVRRRGRARLAAMKRKKSA